ncbi:MULTISPECIES: RdgB/HAM1 family non-canonical purine NTP pyrophosphatase [unclassified Campylobacter]|uniref:RdgB/HAM1 family non-canonical purine NTP pyrophosphatase n=1 Tax=unclassified Campylobacter TaxID=2593542 RepID=UPI001237B8F3|nr:MULTISPECIES: RdgB/HAM1 family non-canonical purine NTP pyrophosphatase [unclassified Campylobacter]KAA6224932.1 RdgB/HAM1 family non-canonical purine NTP pyrophosphatase [Campylobacter sp. LR286c]KAA6228403.1 RdgB/HAM1 family non-canonical purine NTP pyrophosphatase [Campylobacter sp. LR185c]KAA6228889.1 RdgB/HAM1 family non-canonical purine NTP pyrophosphatase [Campylobacter sp. LR196d]KAA6229843.1 RdgB/HAM1 family non-canonical purine NTP pyrophosphatase [Campylobacter sp. LR264d]KAA6234
MKIILATNNAHKFAELKELLKSYKCYSLNELSGQFNIEENGTSFKENALIKSRAIFNLLTPKDKEKFVVLSDDSGLCVDILHGRPGIFSSRFSGVKDDKANKEKLALELETLGLSESKAYFCCAIAISSKFGDFSTHGFLYGKIITQQKGKNGFGYDSMFIPDNYDKTLAQLSENEKNQISHRSRAIKVAKPILKKLKRNM